ncbi:MAG: hypothetical protein HQL79_08590 [Magnetococcales bacterium]|nr:hypothetical protein [Magnetococcales bacterium]
MKITETEIANALAKLKRGNGMDMVGLLRQLPMHYLAEALVQEMEDGEKTHDRSLANSLDTLLWRVARIIDCNRAVA